MLPSSTQLCSHYYGQAPQVLFLGKEDMTFTYIPAHAYYVVFELLKNSMRATAEFHADEDQLPPITITFAEGERDVCVKV